MLPPTIVGARPTVVPEHPRLPSTPVGIANHAINFNGEAAAYDETFLANAWALGKATNESSPFLDPAIMRHVVERYHTEKGISWSHGGYLEDRTDLWRGSYLTEPVIHGGIDVNLPAGTAVRCMRDGTVVWVDDDHNPAGGWGPYVVVQTRNDAREVEYVLYGHLGTCFVQIGDEIEKGAVVADIGAPPHNGGWWSHLHLQCISKEYYEWCRDNDIDKTLDGYFPASQLEIFRTRFPDPSSLLWDATADVERCVGRNESRECV